MTATPLVFLHAFPCNRSMWEPQLAAFPGSLAPDQRGFGGSALGLRTPDLGQVADDVEHLLDKSGIDRAILCGLSMGGYVAMAFLRRHPDRLAGLILADTKAEIDSEQARENRLRIADRMDHAGLWEAEIRAELTAPLLGATSKATRPELAREVDAMAAGAPRATIAWCQRAMAARPDSTALLAGTTMPVLLVCGEEDNLALASMRRLDEQMPTSTLVTIAGAGHLANLEQPAAFNDAISGYLARVAS